MATGTQDEDAVISARQRQSLPFTVAVVRTGAELAEAIAVRAAAFLRHNAPAAELMRVPEEDDIREDSVLLLARSKFDGGVLGSIRIKSNFVSPMRLEGALDLVERYRNGRSAEFMRLGVVNGLAGQLVTSALAKASYKICVASGIEYIFVGARRSVEAIYKAYQFDDFLGRRLELSYAAGIPHRILCLPVAAAEQRWREAAASVYQFFVATEHPDIQIDFPGVAARLRALARVDSTVA